MRKKPEILIVDDNEKNIFALECVLRDLDAELIKATSGNEALKSILNHEFALALIDVQMPDMNGYELAEFIRGEKKTKSLPIIFLSATMTEKHQIFKGYEAGAVDFITKPFESGILQSKVNFFLELQRQKMELRQERETLRGINRILHESITCKEEKEVARRFLAVAEELTGSSYGFVGELTDSDRLYPVAISDNGWKACAMPESEAERLLDNFRIRGIWKMIADRRDSVMINDLSSYWHSVGTPPGHPKIGRVLGTPIIQGGAVTGLIVLAAGEGAYDQADLEALRVLSRTFIEAFYRTRAELALKKSEERHKELAADLLRSNDELMQFAHIVSHDLQEPLRKVTVFGDRLRSCCADRIGEKGLDYLGRMEKAAERMKHLINGILQLSRISARPMEVKNVDLNAIVEEVISDIEIRIEEMSAVIEVRDLPVIEAEPLQMRQLFMNLISNAMKFCRTAPCIVIAGQTDNGGCHQITITDNGIGFDEKYLDLIFKPFQRLNDRSEYEGIGIGLAICQKIASRHNGVITARSSPDGGSTFIISLPSHHVDAEVSDEAIKRCR